VSPCVLGISTDASMLSLCTDFSILPSALMLQYLSVALISAFRCKHWFSIFKPKPWFNIEDILVFGTDLGALLLTVVSVQSLMTTIDWHIYQNCANRRQWSYLNQTIHMFVVHSNSETVCHVFVRLLRLVILRYCFVIGYSLVIIKKPAFRHDFRQVPHSVKATVS